MQSANRQRSWIMSGTLVGVLLMLASCSASGSAAMFSSNRAPREPAIHKAGEYGVGIGLGTRRQKDEWGQADELFNYFALDLDYQPKRWPLEFSTRINLATVSDQPDFASDQVDRADLTEVDFGLLLPVDLGGGLRAHLGGGLAWAEVTLSDDNYFSYGSDEVDDDDELGWWAGAGFGLPLGAGQTLGLDVRWTELDDLVLEGNTVDASGLTVLLMYSWHRSLR